MPDDWLQRADLHPLDLRFGMVDVDGLALAALDAALGLLDGLTEASPELAGSLVGLGEGRDEPGVMAFVPVDVAVAGSAEASH
jgi:hypothetical protein